MYVVRRSFRNNGEVLTPGAVVEPGDIKFFKSRLKDRKIIEVTPDRFNEWDDYFVTKYATHIQVPVEEAPTKPAKVTARCVAKAVCK